MNFAPKLQHNLQYTYKRVDFYVLLVLILKRFDKICTFDGFMESWCDSHYAFCLWR